MKPSAPPTVANSTAMVWGYVVLHESAEVASPSQGGYALVQVVTNLATALSSATV
jgi:hypothetical protein